MKQYVTTRGKGFPLTERHILIAIRDMIISNAKAVLASSFREAVAAHATSDSETFVVLENNSASSTLPVLGVYTAGVQEHESNGTARAEHNHPTYNLVLLPVHTGSISGEDVQAMLHEWMPGVDVLRCRAPTMGPLDPVRTIVALQAHHNCGTLSAAVAKLRS